MRKGAEEDGGEVEKVEKVEGLVGLAVLLKYSKDVTSGGSKGSQRVYMHFWEDGQVMES